MAIYDRHIYSQMASFFATTSRVEVGGSTGLRAQHRRNPIHRQRPGHPGAWWLPGRYGSTKFIDHMDK